MSKVYKPPKVVKHGNKYAIQYRIPGCPKLQHDSFASEEEAKTRALQVAYKKSVGELRPPEETKNPLTRSALSAMAGKMTMRELLTDYLETRGPTMEAGCLTATERRIKQFIIPQIGEIPAEELTVLLLEDCYLTLSKMEICEQKGKKPHPIGHSTIEKCRADIRAALYWGMDAELIPQGYNAAARSKLPWLKKEEEREDDYVCWDYDEFLAALRLCKNETLRLVILLCVMCTMRIGEVLALDWKHVKVKKNDGETYVHIEYQLQRVKEEHLSRSVKTKAYYVFPKQCEDSKSVLILTDPKKGSKRFVPHGKSTEEAIELHEKRQELEKKLMGAEYQDYGLVIAQPNGRPYEAKVIRNLLADFCEENGFTSICTHSLRHTSVDLKLELSGGDIKAVMADGGYRTEKMVTQAYNALRERRRSKTAARMDALITNEKMPNDLADA